MQLFSRCNCAGRVICEEWRHLERDPSVYTIGAVPNRAEQVGCLRQIFDCEFEEQRLASLSLVELAANGRIITRAVLDRVIEDCRVRCESGKRQVGDVAPQSAAGQQVAGDVVEPDALSELMELLRRLHGFTSAQLRVEGLP